MNLLNRFNKVTLVVIMAIFSMGAGKAQAEIFIFKSVMTVKSMIPKDVNRRVQFYLILDTDDETNTRTVEVYKDKTYTVDDTGFDFDFAVLTEDNQRGKKNFITFIISDSGLVVGSVGTGKTLKLKDVNGDKIEAEFAQSFKSSGTAIESGSPLLLKGNATLDKKLTGQVIDSNASAGVDIVIDYLQSKKFVIAASM